MISAFEEIIGLFQEISDALSEKISVFTIGGMVLLYQGLKPATKDIDLVVEKETEFNVLAETLKRRGFTTKKPTIGYAHMNLGGIFVREDFRIDLFHRKVCGAFFLSPGMIKRAILIQKFRELFLYACANEDIFMFKTMTEREGDLEDCIALAKKSLRWELILQELENQIAHTGNQVWITWVGERMDLLQEKGLEIPIMKDVDALRLEYYEKLEKRLS